MLMLSIDFRIKRPDHEVKRNLPVVEWYSVRKSLMMMVPSKRCKCVHNKLFAVSKHFFFVKNNLLIEEAKNDSTIFGVLLCCPQFKPL